MVQRAGKSPAVWPYGLEASVKDLGARGKLAAVILSLITMVGCGALDANTPAAQSNTGLAATSAVVDFGSVPVGTTQVRTNTITNNTKAPIVLTSAQIDQSEFKVTGQKLPLTLAPGSHVTVQIAYSPRSGGSCPRQDCSRQQCEPCVLRIQLERHSDPREPASAEPEHG